MEPALAPKIALGFRPLAAGRGYHRDVLEAVERALQVDELAPEDEVLLLRTADYCLWAAGDYESCLRICERGLEKAKQIGDQGSVVYFLNSQINDLPWLCLTYADLVAAVERALASPGVPDRDRSMTLDNLAFVACLAERVLCAQRNTPRLQFELLMRTEVPIRCSSRGSADSTSWPTWA